MQKADKDDNIRNANKRTREEIQKADEKVKRGRKNVQKTNDDIKPRRSKE